MQSLLGILMIIPGDIGTLIDFFGFTASIFYCAAMVALIVMRFTKKNEHRPIKVSVVILIREVTSSGCFVANLLLINPGTHHHSDYCYVGFSYSSRRAHRCSPASAILLCAVFHLSRPYFLRTFCLLQENGTGNE
jgi:amino acid transporter